MDEKNIGPEHITNASLGGPEQKITYGTIQVDRILKGTTFLDESPEVQEVRWNPEVWVPDELNLKDGFFRLKRVEK